MLFKGILKHKICQTLHFLYVCKILLFFVLLESYYDNMYYRSYSEKTCNRDISFKDEQ